MLSPSQVLGQVRALPTTSYTPGLWDPPQAKTNLLENPKVPQKPVTTSYSAAAQRVRGVSLQRESHLAPSSLFFSLYAYASLQISAQCFQLITVQKDRVGFG